MDTHPSLNVNGRKYPTKNTEHKWSLKPRKEEQLNQGPT